MWILRILWPIKFCKGPKKNLNGPLKFGNWHVFEWDMGHSPILRAHHHFGLGLTLKFHVIFTFRLQVFKWISTFEMWLIPSWTNRFKPPPHTRHLSGLTSSPSNNVACLLTFAWCWTCIAMTLSAEIWLFQTLHVSYVWFNSKYLENEGLHVNFARDRKYSPFHEPSKNQIHSLNIGQ